MIKYTITVVLLILLFIQMSGHDAVAQSTSPCADYWELSYKHPYLKKADSLYDVERFNDALPLYQSAAEKFNQQQNWEGLLKARNRIADCLRFTPQRDSAFSILRDNLEIIDEHFNNDPLELAEVHFIMGICYDWDNQKEKALEEYNKSLEIRIELYGEQHIDVVRGYYAIGDMFTFDKRTLNAKEYLSKAADISATLNCNNSTIIGSTYYSLASVSRRLGDLEKASIYGFKTLSLFENDPFTRSRCFNLIANVNEEKKEFGQSIKYNTIAINLLQEQRPLSNSHQQNLANYLHSLANIHRMIQQYDSAHLYYQQSLQIYNKLQEQNEVLLVYQNIGVNYYLLGQYDSADYYLSKAVNLRKQVNGEKHFGTSSSLREKGAFYEHLGQLDSALHYYQQAIIAGSGLGFNSYQPTINPKGESFSYDDDGNLLRALYSKGKVLKRIYAHHKSQKNLELSLETLLLAIELMDRNQQLYLLEGSTLFMAEDYYSIFEDALSVCYDLYELTDNRQYLEKAFLIIEKSKARLLFDTFSDLQQSRMAGIPDSLVNVENSIKSKLASLSRNLENEMKKDSVNNQKIRDLEDKVFEATVDLENFQQFLQSAYPSYASAIENEPLNLSTILNKLSEEHRILINYFWGDSTLFSLVLQNDQINFFKQPVDTLKQLVRIYQRHLHEGPQFTNQTSRFKDYHENAYSLFTVLFKGIHTDERPLIIAADGPLRFIPFEGLVVTKPEPEITKYDQLNYVVHYYPTSYVYSANLWAMQPQREPVKTRVLGFSHSALDMKNSLHANELPGTAREIEVLKGQLNGTFFSGLEATKQNFLDHAQDYDIIHLSIHGISDSVSRLNNRLLFRNPDDQTQTDPLYTYELYNLQLNSRLVVLSACESGTGRNYQGEGVYSMSRAFSYAGCPTTVMSLWRISDKTTPEILEEFYQQISKRKNIDLALRNAKLSYLEKHQGSAAHPSYWAAMVVHGNTDQVMKKSRTALILPIVIVLLVLTFLFIKDRLKLQLH